MNYALLSALILAVVAVFGAINGVVSLSYREWAGSFLSIVIAIAAAGLAVVLFTL